MLQHARPLLLYAVTAGALGAWVEAGAAAIPYAVIGLGMGVLVALVREPAGVRGTIISMACSMTVGVIVGLLIDGRPWEPGVKMAVVAFFAAGGTHLLRIALRTWDGVETKGRVDEHVVDWLGRLVRRRTGDEDERS